MTSVAQWHKQARMRRFWDNFRAARKCTEGFCLVVVGYVPTYRLRYRRALHWHAIAYLRSYLPQRGATQ